ncbi:MAG: hemolysin III [Alphaproteobacteria bacterium]|jgi:hemolysin III
MAIKSTTVMLPKKSLDQVASNTYSVAEEKLNALSHAIGLVLALVGIIALLIKAEGAQESLVAAVYGTSLALMFLTSTLYHSSRNVKTKLLLRKLDHIAIYLLIAGTYTPFLVLGVGSNLAFIGLVVVWAIAFVGIFFKLYFGHKYPKLSISTYAIMGWLALLLIYPIYLSLNTAGFTLLIIGGLCYSAGIPLYLLKSRHYSHALWHFSVIAGAACHFAAIYSHII